MHTRGDGRPRRVRSKIDPRAFESALNALVADLERRFYSTALKEHVLTALPGFFAYLRKERVFDLRGVSEAHVTTYARHLGEQRSTRGTPYAPATRRWQLDCIKRLFVFLVKEGVVLHDPTLDLELPAWRTLPRALLNQAQSGCLVVTPDPKTDRGKRDRAVLELLYGTGIRVGECERLDLKDLDLARGVLFIRDGKGRKDRVVPVAGQAAAALDVYLRDARPAMVKDPRESALFLTAWGTRLTKKRVQALVGKHGEAARLPVKTTPHMLRHACATHLLQGGADIRDVQKLLGHAQLDTTAIYARVAPKDLARAVAKAHPRERTWARRKPRKE